MKKYVIIFKIISFVFIFCILWNIVFNILWIDKTPLSYFYEEPKNTLDIVYIGHSNAYQHFNTTLAFKKYGFTTGLMATDAQNFSAVEYLIKESKKYQSPKLYVIDLAKAADNLGDYKNSEFRQLPDSMKFNKNRIDIINKVLAYKNIPKKEYINYYFSFLIYHNRWKDYMNGKQTNENKNLYKGFELSEQTIKTISNPIEWSKDKNELQEDNKKVLYELISYINNNHLNVLFVVPPRIYTIASNTRLNYLIDILQSNGFNVINFNDSNDYKININEDFYNIWHLNICGSTKFTLYLSNYIHKNYNLNDYRYEIQIYNSWNSEYERLKKKFKELTNKDFEELVNKYDIY